MQVLLLPTLLALAQKAVETSYYLRKHLPLPPYLAAVRQINPNQLPAHLSRAMVQAELLNALVVYRLQSGQLPTALGFDNAVQFLEGAGYGLAESGFKGVR